MNLDNLRQHPLLRRELLPHYAPSFLTWFVTLMTFFAVAWYSAEREDVRVQRLQEAQRRERAALDDENRALAERQSIIEYGAKYQQLRRLRTASDEDRLYLFESLLLYNRLPAFRQLNFTVGAQQNAQVTLPYPLEAQVLRASEVNMQFQTHNYRTFAFFLEGMKRMPGLLKPMQCQVKNNLVQNNASNITPEQRIYPLDVHCRFAWLSFNKPSQDENNNNE